MDRLLDYLKDRLREASTWRGLVLILTAIGVPLSPQQGEAIVIAGLGLAGVIGVLSKDS